MEQNLNQRHNVKKIQKRNLSLKNQIVVVNYNRAYPENYHEYGIAVCLSYDEIFGEFGLDILDLKRVLFSEENNVMGLVFEYFDLNKEPCKDIIISKKLNDRQCMAFLRTPKDNIVVVATKKDGTVVNGIQSEIVIKK